MDRKKGSSKFLECSEMNSAAAYNLACCYVYGYGVAKDEKKGVELFKKSAQQGSARGKLGLALCKYYGVGTQQDMKGCLKLTQEATDQKLPAAEFFLGMSYITGELGVDQNYQEAVAYFKRAQMGGSRKADTGLGICYLDGTGVEKDNKEAFAHFQRASKQGNTHAVYCLGKCYENGWGTKKDIVRSAIQYRASAKRGHNDSQMEMGNFYKESSSSRNMMESYRKAADNGSQQAMHKLGDIYLNGFNDIKPDFQLALLYFEQAAAADSGESFYMLGHIYQNGRGTARNDAKAVEYFQKAAALDHYPSQTALGDCYFRGKGVTKNRKNAISWYTSAALGDDSNGMYNLAQCLRMGHGVGRDEAEGTIWLKASAAKGNPGAQYTLGCCYQNGVSVQQNDGIAVAMFSASALKGDINAQYELARCYTKGQGTKVNIPDAMYWYAKADRGGHRSAGGKLRKLKKKYPDAMEKLKEQTATSLSEEKKAQQNFKVHKVPLEVIDEKSSNPGLLKDKDTGSKDEVTEKQSKTIVSTKPRVVEREKKPILISGWLEKLSNKKSMLGSDRFQNRWFELDDTNLNYYKDEEANVLASFIPLKNIKTVMRTGKFNNCISIDLKLSDRVYLMQAETKKSAGHWQRAIMKALKQYRVAKLSISGLRPVQTRLRAMTTTVSVAQPAVDELTKGKSLHISAGVDSIGRSMLLEFNADESQNSVSSEKSDTKGSTKEIDVTAIAKKDGSLIGLANRMSSEDQKNIQQYILGDNDFDWKQPQAIAKAGYEILYGMNSRKIDFRRGKNMVVLGAGMGVKTALGLCYWHGWGVNKDTVKAVECFGDGIDNMEEDSKAFLGMGLISCDSLFKTTVRSSKRDSFAVGKSSLLPKPDQGLIGMQMLSEAAEPSKSESSQTTLGLYNLAVVYFRGKRVPIDSKKALNLFMQAAKRGDARARYAIGIVYLYGVLGTKDEKGAIRWLTLAANQGLPSALNELGYCFSSGIGTEASQKKAMEFFMKAVAADKDNGHAQFNLGCSYQMGLGVDKDAKKARECFEKAVESGNPNAKRMLGATHTGYSL